MKHSGGTRRTAESPRTPFLTTKLAAQYLALSPKTLEKFRVYGGGPRFRKHGSKVVYAKADLEAWSEERTYESTSQVDQGGTG